MSDRRRRRRRRRQAVVRLCRPQYDAAAFRTAGVAVADLPFDDCAAPPADVVGKCAALPGGFSASGSSARWGGGGCGVGGAKDARYTDSEDTPVTR